MEKSGKRILIYYTDPNFDLSLARRADGLIFDWRFTQNEDYYLHLDSEIEVSSLKIHHNFSQKRPNLPYMKAMELIIGQIADRIPSLFSGLHWYFDATEVLKPGFFQILNKDGDSYLLILKIDLLFRPGSCRIIQMGSNDETPVYRSNKLFLEVDLIPLESMHKDPEGVFEFQISQTVSETWIGETGRGYFVQGMWLDRDLTKFFSKAILPPGKNIYPYYPLNCKYRSVCFQPYDLSPEGRQKAVDILHSCRKYLEPSMRDIENELKQDDFSEKLLGFLALSERISPEIKQYFVGVSTKAYINSDDNKEYTLNYEKI